MTNKEKCFKACVYDDHYETTNGEVVGYIVVYRETHYAFHCSTETASNSRFEREDFEIVADEFTSYRTSIKMHSILAEGIYKFSSYPTTRYEASDKPEGKRIRPLGHISHLLNCALASYIRRYHDTPTKDDLWRWIFTESNCLAEVGFYVNEQGELLKIRDDQILTLETFTRKFNAKIGTKSWAYQEELEDKQFKAEWGITKKPRGRPRKNPWRKDL